MIKKLIFIAFICYLPLQLKLPNVPIFPVINILSLLMLGIFLSSRNENFIRPKFETPMILFLLIWLFSFIYACMFTDGMERIEIAREFKRLYLLPLGYFIISRCITNKKEIPYYFGVFLLCLVFAGHNTLRNGVLAGANFAVHKRSSGPFGWGWQASDIAGGYLGTFVPLLVSYFFFARKGLFKLASAIGVGACGLGLMATYSRGSMMALLFACIAVVLVGSKELAKESKINFLVIIIGLVIGIVFWKAWVPQSIIARVEGTIELDEEEKEYYDYSLEDDEGESVLDASSQLRMKAWDEGLQFFLENPLTGIGFRQVQFQLGHDPHNAFVLIASEMGIIGILIFIWLILSVIGQGFRLMGTEFNNLAVGSVGMMVGFIVVNCFYSNFFRDNVIGSFWVILGILAAANSLLQNQADDDGSDSNTSGPKDKSYAEYRKRYLKSIIIFVLFSLTCTAAHAKPAGRWWSQEDVPILNALTDIDNGAKGRIFYVDPKNGDDKNDGQLLRTAFKSISGAKNLQPGDVVLIKAGIYREQFWVTSKGEKNARIVIGPYGDGEVIIDAGLRVGPWETHQGGIFKTKTEYAPKAIVVNEIPLYEKETISALSEGDWFYDKSRKMIYMYPLKGVNPNDQDVGVVADDKYNHAIFLNGAEYVTLYGLTIRFAGGKGVEILGPNNRIERCNIKFNGSNGIGMFNYENVNSKHTEVIKNHIYHNFMANWPRGRWPYKNGGWGMGVGGPAKGPCLLIGNVVHKNGGEGLGVPGSGSLIYDNIIFNNWSVNLYLEGSANIVADQNFIYCNEPDLRDLYKDEPKHPKGNSSYQRLRAEGIMTGDEEKATNQHNVQITNNIIINCRRGITHYGRTYQSGLKNVFVAHNTIIVPDSDGGSENFIGINVPWNEGNNAGTFYRNNLVYASHPKTYLVSVAIDPLHRTEPFQGISFDHNLYFHASSNKPFYLGIPKFTLFQAYDFSGWLQRGEEKAIDQGSQFKDPKFLARKGYTAESVRISPDSPAVNSAVLIEGLVTDYMGNPRDAQPDIGALEVITQ